MTTFRNFTPHPIVLTSGEVFTSEGIARVSATFSEPVNGICEQVFGEIAGLPNPAYNTIFIVSAIVLSAAKNLGRTDCVAPATGHPLTVRNESGHIISVPCFVK